MTDEPESDGSGDRFEAMREKADELMRRCHFDSAARLSGETARLAKSSGEAMHYIHARFHEMDQSQYNLDLATMKESAIELIAVIEDEDRARSIQPDLPQDYYEYTQQWMTACLYENLAEATGMMEGYNSQGLHQCIGDGIQVCRRTGKLQCIACFREYATDVYTAADDMLLARNQCEAIAARESGWSNRGDRRWLAQIKLSWIHLLEGRLDLAIETARKANELVDVDGVSLKMECRMRVLADLDTALILADQPRIDWSSVHPDGSPDYPLPKGEWLGMEFRVALNDALAACCNDCPDDAVEILTAWDRQLTEHRCGHLWFELRLRLIAAMLLNGDDRRAERMAAQLKERALASNDFLTLRRLERLLDRTVAPNPLATVAPLNSGLFAEGPTLKSQPKTASTASADAYPTETADDDESQNTGGPEREVSAHQIAMLEILRTYFTSEDPAEKEAAANQILAMTPDSFTDMTDACATLHFATMVATNHEHPELFWEWAQSFEQHFSDEPSVLSMVAVLGEGIRDMPDSPLVDVIDEDRLLKLHRLALSMDVNRIGNHQRAGEFFLRHGDVGEAERCLARAFRLDRTCVPAARQLSQIYRETDRPRDALDVLDICLREGGSDPDLAMDATTLALLLGQFESTLIYAEKIRQLSDEDPGWVDYYRAIALIELGRCDEALEAIEAERRHEPPSELHLDLLSVCALLQMDRTDEALEFLQKVNQYRLSEVDFLTFNALCRLFGMTWHRVAGSTIPANHAERCRFETIMLQAGLAPDDYFETFRTPLSEDAVVSNDKDAHPLPDEVVDLLDEDEDADGGPRVNCYQCVLKQPLNDSWPESAGCLASQQEWDHYLCTWRLLAADEDAAAEMALEWQRKSSTGLAAEVLDVQLESGPYRDSPGPVTQGMRWCDGPDTPE
ncbi:MAG: tetratricopeptide repeat protein [Planctomycetaceae bacterium]|nr:tetratricopeptide repeat protein [Planctomycetaceae bacterium]